MLMKSCSCFLRTQFLKLRTVEAESGHVEVNNQDYHPVCVVLDLKKNCWGFVTIDILPPGMKNLILIKLRRVICLACRNL